MKQLIVSVFLAVLLVGCDEKPKFSINEDDIVTGCINKPSFIKLDNPSDHVEMGCKFLSAPDSVYGIKTHDLTIVGGYYVSIVSNNKNYKQIFLDLKGKKSFDILIARIREKNKHIQQDEVFSYEKGLGFVWREDGVDDGYINYVIAYDPFLDFGSLIIDDRNNY